MMGTAEDTSAGGPRLAIFKLLSYRYRLYSLEKKLFVADLTKCQYRTVSVLISPAIVVMLKVCLQRPK